MINRMYNEVCDTHFADEEIKIQQGDKVSLCLETEIDNQDQLIKRVIAVPGDTVVLTRDSIIVNGLLYPYPTQRTDDHGRRLYAYPRGIYPGTPGYWVVSINSIDSLDSRYCGPISRSKILCPIENGQLHE